MLDMLSRSFKRVNQVATRLQLSHARKVGQLERVKCRVVAQPQARNRDNNSNRQLHKFSLFLHELKQSSGLIACSFQQLFVLSPLSFAHHLLSSFHHNSDAIIMRLFGHRWARLRQQLSNTEFATCMRRHVCDHEWSA